MGLLFYVFGQSFQADHKSFRIAHHSTRKDKNSFPWYIYGMKLSADHKKIDEFLSRGVENIYPNRAFVEAKLKDGKPLHIYAGVDPTAPTLHLGHAILIKKLKEFQDLGHRVTLLVGDFTAMIGDPTDKLAARKQLSRKEVLANARSYKKQASAFLRFSGRNKAEIKYNSRWLSKMPFEKVIQLTSLMTVEQMAKRDMFARRIKEGKPIYIHEFLYPLMQGYDSVVMDVDGEMGGNDQTFNMLAGRTLMKQMKNKEKFVIALKLLTDKEGKKMGKTEGNMVAFSDTPPEMYGKIMSWSDGMILPGFELCTYVSMDEIATIAEGMEKGRANPRDMKMRLAREIVSIYHGEQEAQKAEQHFVATFQKKNIPQEIGEVTAEKHTLLADILLKKGLVASKMEFRRLVREGAIKKENGDRVIDERYVIEQDAVFKVGKRRFVKVVIR